MSVAAVGLYLRTLREEQGLSRGDLVFALRQRKLTLDERQLARIEAGEIDTRGSLLLGITNVLRGSYERVAELMFSDSADTAMVEQYVAEWSRQREAQPSQEQTAELAKVRERLYELAADPAKLLELIREDRREGG